MIITINNIILYSMRKMPDGLWLRSRTTVVVAVIFVTTFILAYAYHWVPIYIHAAEAFDIDIDMEILAGLHVIYTHAIDYVDSMPRQPGRTLVLRLLREIIIQIERHECFPGYYYELSPSSVVFIQTINGLVADSNTPKGVLWCIHTGTTFVVSKNTSDLASVCLATEFIHKQGILFEKLPYRMTCNVFILAR